MLPLNKAEIPLSTEPTIIAGFNATVTDEVAGEVFVWRVTNEMLRAEITVETR
jgi:hypothetical protein